MKPVIYADTLFLLNFLMNTVILIITEKILTRKIPVFRIVISSAMGGVYSVLMFLTEYKILYSLILKIVILFGICYMAFGGGNIKKATKNFCGFILVNLCMGGAMTALIFLTDFGTTVGAVVCGNGVYLNLSPIILLLGILGTYILLGIYRRMCRRRLYEQSLIKRFEIDGNEIIIYISDRGKSYFAFWIKDSYSLKLTYTGNTTVEEILKLIETVN